MEDLFLQWAGEPLLSKSQISANGSNRRYYRCRSRHHVCVAAENADVRENEAFFYFAEVLRHHGVAVPEVYGVSRDRTIYLQEDLGDETLYARLAALRAAGQGAEEETLRLYRQAIDDLLEMQQLGNDGQIDFSHAYPRPKMDRQALQWDLNYFKYDFLKLLHVPFDEQRLEDDFLRLTDYLLAGDCNYFLYRDFQARNIMMAPDGGLRYIDFQGARQGSPLYDVASLLYSSKSGLAETQRESLLDYYLERFAERHPSGTVLARELKVARQARFYMYVLARMMQAMGAYGYRGLYEGKDYFVSSIPLAVSNLHTLLQRHPLSLPLPELERVWQRIGDVPQLRQYDSSILANTSPLCVHVFSFSFKRGVPEDTSGNGGGYVFDCRALPNPGRYVPYQMMNGRDLEVVQFLENGSNGAATSLFFQHASAMVSQHVDNFIQRGFSSLTVGFGCTGGRHRSVYFAERMGRWLCQRYPNVRVEVHHCEQPYWDLAATPKPERT